MKETRKGAMKETMLREKFKIKYYTIQVLHDTYTLYDIQIHLQPTYPIPKSLYVDWYSRSIETLFPPNVRTCMNPCILTASRLEEDLRILLREEEPRADRMRHHLGKVESTKASRREARITRRVSYLRQEERKDKGGGGGKEEGRRAQMMIVGKAQKKNEEEKTVRGSKSDLTETRRRDAFIFIVIIIIIITNHLPRPSIVIIFVVVIIV